ncbi:hypothetical protein [Ruminiclostridium papyrosolvens]|uniref:General stress protein 17M-like domain-containing protein n=1 Tax=Ruminiclostridium papyrosolvens C7 TaxID=1330534 RepID=U4R1G3_9FIRM|nr:hypothetical protein [Ruminiclostridium papyrosolvens]EPR11879.1 hypothetical protein L323_10420 [Ruminiclostridium papyrosolvens C7]
MAKTVVAIFEDYENAEKAAHQIREKGLRTDNISIITKTGSNINRYKPTDGGSIETRGKKSNPFVSPGSLSVRISDGIVTGGIIGGILGILIGGVSMFIQGLGFVAAAGPIGGLFVGLLAGGLIGGFIDFKVPRNKKKEFEKLISNGNALFSMMTDEDRSEDILEILKKNGALMVEKYQ